MAGFLQGLSTQRNINKTTVHCAPTQGVLNVYVHAIRAPGMLPAALLIAPGVPHPIPNVTATITGTPNPVTGVTKSDGHKGFGPYPLPPAYTVTLSNIPAKYDANNVNPGIAQTKNLNAGVATVYDFVIPWHWIVFQVENSINQADGDLPYKLRYQAPATVVWTLLESGKLPANGMLVKDEINAGRYRLSILELSNPTWQHPDVRLGRGETLTVSASGFEVGDQGEFQIVDAFDDTKVIHTIPCQVSQAGVNFQLQTTWMPSSGQLTALTQSRIAFKAKCQGVECLSGPLTVYSTDTLDIQQPDGTPIVAPVTVYFSNGATYQGNSINGVAIMTLPWKEKIVRIDLTLANLWRGKGTGEGQPDWLFTSV
jgi:hypothetical protein